jgi:cyanophycin synthetase
MEITNTRILRGPNHWANQKVIIIQLNQLENEQLPTNLLKGFTAHLKALMPSLYNDFGSYSMRGGFFKCLEDGILLSQVVEHIAVELQCLAGMNCDFSTTQSTSEKGTYQIVFNYQIEQAGIYAGKAAVNIVQTLAQQKDYNSLEEDIKELKRIYELERLGPSTEAIVKEAEKRDIPCARLDKTGMMMLGQGCHQKIICCTLTGQTSCLGADIARNKENTKEILAASLIPVPRGKIVASLQELSTAILELNFPIALKPLSGNQGRGITTNIRTPEKAIEAFKIAKKFCEYIIVERYIKGIDYRLLVINYSLIAAVKRTPAMVTGDGIKTIQELVEDINANPERGQGHQNFLTKIEIDEITHSILTEQGLTLDSVLAKGTMLLLQNTANLSTGGTAMDVTHFVHPYNVFLAERIARLVNLDICGIDIVTQDIAAPITKKNGAVIEVNANPGFRMHLSPTRGMKRNVAKPVIDMLFPEGKSSRIPIVAVTGTHGKTTIVKLIAHLAKLAGHQVGLTSSDGVYLQEQVIYEGACGDPLSASMLLRDPLIDFAIFECPRSGIIRSGLGFDKCDISIISTLSEDYLTNDKKYTLEDVARVKSVVPKSTFDHGYAILNADNSLVYAMQETLSCHIALFSMSYCERICKHCEEGGLAAYLEEGFIIIQRGQTKNKVIQVADIDQTFMDDANCLIKNILPALLAGVLCQFQIPNILNWLSAIQTKPVDLQQESKNAYPLTGCQTAFAINLQNH